MDTEAHIIRSFDWRDFADGPAWETWRAAKIRTSQWMNGQPPVRLDSLSHCSPGVRAELKRRCALVNFATYQVDTPDRTAKAASAALGDFARSLGLTLAEDHRSADELGIVALQTSSPPSKKGYIPYTARPLNWHTDGYYNDGSEPVQAFILHCHQQAASGGENQLLDPELAYLHLRQIDPRLVGALMHPRAMTIPENREPDGTPRPASVGPVFFADRRSKRMQMRYTARTRSIEWRDDPDTIRATGLLSDWLASGDPMIASVRLRPGQGIVSNNVLHNRTGFADASGAEGARVMLRARFHERLAEDQLGAA